MAKYSVGVETRSRVLDAALETLRSEGPQGLTLDAVAREAGVSKGGLLHHFATKDALVEALLRQLMADFHARVETYAARESIGAGRWLRAYIHATFEEDPIPLELSLMLAVSLIQSEALRELVREDTVAWQRRLADDGVPPARAAVIRHAADAYWTERLIGGLAADRDALLAELLALTETGP